MITLRAHFLTPEGSWPQGYTKLQTKIKLNQVPRNDNHLSIAFLICLLCPDIFVLTRIGAINGGAQPIIRQNLTRVTLIRADRRGFNQQNLNWGIREIHFNPNMNTMLTKKLHLFEPKVKTSKNLFGLELSLFYPKVKIGFEFEFESKNKKD